MAIYRDLRRVATVRVRGEAREVLSAELCGDDRELLGDDRAEARRP